MLVVITLSSVIIVWHCMVVKSCFKVDKKLYLLINLLFVSKFDIIRFKLTINTLIDCQCQTE